MKDATFPIVLIAVGGLWLLHNLDWIPDTRWIAAWVLVIAGVAVLALEGLTKKSVIGGPLMIGLGLLWMLRLKAFIELDVVLPCALILLGALMLLARHPAIPETRPPKAAPGA